MAENVQEQNDETLEAVNESQTPAPDLAAGEPVSSDGQTPRDDIAVLQAEVERLKMEASTHLDGWQRERAEFANFRRRSEVERSQLVFLTGVRIIEKLLPLIDDFDRALANLPDDLKDNGWIDGVRLTRRKLIGLLESEGLSIIPVAPGDAFDPSLHEAVTHEHSDQLGEGQIIAELQTGYRIGDRVLRPSLVRVAR